MGPIPVVFVHGLWIHPTSWQPWIERFRNAGYDPTAPGWPGDPATVEQANDDPDRLAGYGIEEIVEHHKRHIGGLEERPIVVGHSFGGLIAQRLLAEDFAVAAVAIDPAPIKGVLRLPISAVRVAWPALRNPANRRKSITLTSEQFRYGFGNAVSQAESDSLYRRWAIPGPAKPLFEAGFANVTLASPAKVDTKTSTRGPLLLIGGGHDHTAPVSVTRATYRRYRKSTAVTEILEFPDRGHSLTLDSRWRDIADASIGWLAEQSLNRSS
jgi:pimeloyl-ACP methyl ester carboxylesterase